MMAVGTSEMTMDSEILTNQKLLGISMMLKIMTKVNSVSLRTTKMKITILETSRSQRLTQRSLINYPNSLSRKTMTLSPTFWGSTVSKTNKRHPKSQLSPLNLVSLNKQGNKI